MRTTTRFRLAVPALWYWIGGLIGAICLATAVVSCGGGSTAISSAGTGTVNVSLTDPPSCAFPNGAYDHVYITVRSVQANINGTADDSSTGWQELAPQLNTLPKQIDLFAAASNTCLLTALGSNIALPTGSYQQIRLLLVPNDGSGPLPATNACAGHGYNCVFLHAASSPVQLDLSSQANTGLKIPPGQVVGGPIVVGAGADVDLNIDFNACASIIQEGNGAFRLKPVLTAGQVSTNNTGISGQVVVQGTLLPISLGTNGTVLVSLEQPDSTGTDVIYEQTVADANGNFNFCPLPPASTFDVVAVAIDGSGIAYNATVAVGVPGGTNLGKIPLAPETGIPAGPTTFQGFVTAKATSTTVASIDASVAALQTISLGGGLTRDVAIPAEGASIAPLSVSTSTGCPIGAPMNSNCAQYTLIVPASNPRVGIFSGGAISSYSVPATTDVLYKIRANAAIPLSGGTSDCTPSSVTTSLDSSSNPLKALAGTTVPVREIDFTGCM